MIKTKYKKDTPYDNVFHQANKFMRLVESYLIDELDFFDLNVVYINMLMAIELFLKAVLLKNGVKLETIKSFKHNLYKLYSELPEGIKKHLKERFQCFYKIDLVDLLDKVKNDYIDCRYMFLESNEEKYKLYFKGVEKLMYDIQHMTSMELYGKDTYRELM